LFNRTLVKPNNIAVIENLAKGANVQVAKRAREAIAEWSRDYGTKIPQFAAVNAKFTGASVQSSRPASAPVAPAPSAPAFAPPQQQQAPMMPRSSAIQQQQAPTASSINNKPPKQNKKEKLKQDLDAVRDTIELLLDMVTVAGNHAELKNPTVYEIVANCKEMHRRVIQLIERVPEEEILLELIQVNDELADVLDYYETFKKSNVKRDKVPAKPVRLSSPQNAADSMAKQSNAPDMFMDQQQPVVPLLAPPPSYQVPSSVNNNNNRPVAASAVNKPSQTGNQLFSIDDLLAGSNAQPALSAQQQPNSLNPFEDPILQHHGPVSDQPPAYYDPHQQQQQQYYYAPPPAQQPQQPYYDYNLQLNQQQAQPQQQPLYPNLLTSQQQQVQPQPAMDPFELVIADSAPVQPPQRPVQQQQQPPAADAFLLPPPKSDQQTKKRGVASTASPAPAAKASVASDFENFLNSVSNTQQPQQQQQSQQSSSNNNLFSLE